MKRWFIKVYDNGYVNKNKLHKAIKEHMMNIFDNRHTNNADQVISLIKGDLEFLNKAHSKCKPISVQEASKWTYNDEDGTKLYFSDVGLRIHLYEFKGKVSRHTSKAPEGKPSSAKAMEGKEGGKP
jgi:hypothetical protein